MTYVLTVTVLCVLIAAILLSAASSEHFTEKDTRWVWRDGNQLYYKTYGRNDRIMDYSGVGYMGGGVRLPDEKFILSSMPLIRLNPNNKDDTASLQEAVDRLAKLPVNSAGFRGAVILSGGTFRISKSIRIEDSGIIVKGSGRQSTTIQFTGKPAVMFAVNTDVTANDRMVVPGKCATIADDYVPIGTTEFRVSDASKLAAGMNVMVVKTINELWIRDMKMHNLKRNGKPQTWLSPQTKLVFERTIVAIGEGNKITIDAPLSDRVDSRYSPGSFVCAYTFPSRISQVALMDFTAVAPFDDGPINKPCWYFVVFGAVQDSWVRNVSANGFMSAVYIAPLSKRITVESVVVNRIHEFRDKSAGAPFDFSVAGQLNLLSNCTSIGKGVFSFASQARVVGPNVLYKFMIKGPGQSIQPHQRWATGLLIDNAQGGMVEFINRRNLGSGHGWTIGNGVVWNSDLDKIEVDNPPGYKNFAIGTSGTVKSSSGELSDDIAGISSLYLAQLSQRFGRPMTTPYL